MIPQVEQYQTIVCSIKLLSARFLQRKNKMQYAFRTLIASPSYLWRARLMEILLLRKGQKIMRIV